MQTITSKLFTRKQLENKLSTSKQTQNTLYTQAITKQTLTPKLPQNKFLLLNYCKSNFPQHNIFNQEGKVVPCVCVFVYMYVCVYVFLWCVCMHVRGHVLGLQLGFKSHSSLS